MSLLDEAMDLCVMMDKSSQAVPDMVGGLTYTWSEGAEFYAAIVLSNSIEARIGQAQGVTAVYTITTSKNVNLQYHDVFKRKADSKTFRVTSDGDDLKTPDSATLDMRQVSAEEWKIPSD